MSGRDSEVFGGIIGRCGGVVDDESWWWWGSWVGDWWEVYLY